MKTRAWYIGLSINVLLALTLISGGAWYFTQKTTPEPVVATAPKTATVEAPKPVATLNKDKLYALISLERVRAGLAPLTVNVLLEQSACAKAQYMIDKNYWSHDAPDGTQPWYFFEQAGYVYDRAGENQAYNHRTDASLVAAWMNSPLHKQNILGDYKETGICVMNDVAFQGKESTNVIVQHFGTQ